MDRFRGFAGGIVGAAGAFLASLCCVLPLTVVLLGVGSGAFMATTNAYRGVLIPAGVLGVGLGLALYVRERRRCDALACRVAGGRVTLALLMAAGLVVAGAIVLDRFPEMTSDLLMRAMSGAEAGGRPAGP